MWTCTEVLVLLAGGRGTAHCQILESSSKASYNVTFEVDITIMESAAAMSAPIFTDLNFFPDLNFGYILALQAIRDNKRSPDN
jgi:hypothetical protein